jgi:hypothetical protein
MKICDINKTAWDEAGDEGTNPYTQMVSSYQVTPKANKW